MAINMKVILVVIMFITTTITMMMKPTLKMDNAVESVRQCTWQCT
jgi:hypothetical protein